MLDAHRKRQQEQHPDLTLTGLYNVLQKIRSGEALNAKDKLIHDQGLVSVLKQIHDDLDAAVLEAYGWSDLSRSVGVSPTSEEKESGRDANAPCADIFARGGPDAEALEQVILTRLVALNHERVAEEKRGLIRYLRPDFQNSNATAPQPVPTILQGTDDPSFKSTILNQKANAYEGTERKENRKLCGTFKNFTYIEIFSHPLTFEMFGPKVSIHASASRHTPVSSLARLHGNRRCRARAA